ncbi:hypothetical protein MSIMFB_04566 [Mycobacterium simulans]|uniref:Uncharacterized protein n=1 Tax=Mycobacterium simulans TaxID=627089 RepID=A0A7Z7INV6_9MYCO|nr:hypothetical protein MSIMFB_04566 [Mycobacterium simulans]
MQRRLQVVNREFFGQSGCTAVLVEQNNLLHSSPYAVRYGPQGCAVRDHTAICGPFLGAVCTRNFRRYEAAVYP